MTYTDLEDMEQTILKDHGVNLDVSMENSPVFEDAFSHMNNKEYEKALEGFRTYLGVVKNHKQSYGNIGLCLAMIGRKKNALEAFDKAMEIDPNYLPAKVNRKEVLTQKEGEPLEYGAGIHYEFLKIAR